MGMHARRPCATGPFYRIAAGYSRPRTTLTGIARDRYEVETEHVCRRWNKDAFHDKRIDLLIRGNGWQIVIENKIYSEVATIKRHTQLDNYRRYIEKTMPGDYDRTLFILLSHCDNSAYCGDCWRYADYSYVFNSLIASPTDPIIENYLATLFRLLSPRLGNSRFAAGPDAILPETILPQKHFKTTIL